MVLYTSLKAKQTHICPLKRGHSRDKYPVWTRLSYAAKLFGDASLQNRVNDVHWKLTVYYLRWYRHDLHGNLYFYAEDRCFWLLSVMLKANFHGKFPMKSPKIITPPCILHNYLDWPTSLTSPTSHTVMFIGFILMLDCRCHDVNPYSQYSFVCCVHLIQWVIKYIKWIRETMLLE